MTILGTYFETDKPQWSLTFEVRKSRPGQRKPVPVVVAAMEPDL